MLQTLKSSCKRDATTAAVGEPELEKSPKLARTIAVKKPGRPLGSFTVPRIPIIPKAPVLRTSKPLKTAVPLDVWDQIIRYSTLSSAISISKVSRDLRDFLSKASLWRAVRHNVYGHDHPDPPPGMTERCYADLLVGNGCQSKGCHNNRAKQTCWAFQRRWCVSCLKKKTISMESCSSFLKTYPGIATCVARVDLAHFTIVKDNSQNNPSWIGFLRTDLARIISEFGEAEKRFGCRMNGIESNVGLQAWLDEKIEAENTFVEKLLPIETWATNYRVQVREAATTKKQEKLTFFIGKARSMDPSLNLPALMKLECFRHAIVSKAKPSERAWKSLEKKVRSEQQRKPVTTIQAQNCIYYDFELIEEEDGNPNFEYIIVKNAKEKLDRIFKHEKDTLLLPMPDDDFMRSVLEELYVKNQQTMAEDDPNLTMDHARLVCDKILKPAIAENASEDRQRAVAQLICPACEDGNTRKQEDFVSLMNHIWNEHLEQGPGSEGINLRRVKQTQQIFPWKRLKWPESLPILAAGEVASECKIRMIKPARELYADDGPGAFDDRVAATYMGEGNSDFVEDVLFAASLFEETRLEDKYRTQIALEYGCQRLSKGSPPPRARFEDLQTALICNGIPGLFEGFRCRECCEAARLGGTVGYFARSVKPLAKLGEHYFSKHDPASWSEKMLSLPSPQELLAQLRLSRNRKAWSIFSQLFPIETDVALDPRLVTGCSRIGEEMREEDVAEAKDFLEEDGEEEEVWEEDEGSGEDEGSEEYYDSQASSISVRVQGGSDGFSLASKRARPDEDM
ncbi:MAG: hypothetical protein Q9216_003460 [Gyalolechia sp. 2 TL-2023]